MVETVTDAIEKYKDLKEMIIELSKEVNQLTKDNANCHNDLKTSTNQIDKRLSMLELDTKYVKKSLEEGKEHFAKLNGKTKEIPALVSFKEEQLAMQKDAKNKFWELVKPTILLILGALVVLIVQHADQILK